MLDGNLPRFALLDSPVLLCEIALMFGILDVVNIHVTLMVRLELSEEEKHLLDEGLHVRIVLEEVSLPLVPMVFKPHPDLVLKYPVPHRPL